MKKKSIKKKKKEEGGGGEGKGEERKTCMGKYQEKTCED